MRRSKRKRGRGAGECQKETNYIKMADKRALKKVRPKHLYHHAAKFFVLLMALDPNSSDVKFFLNP